MVVLHTVCEALALRVLSFFFQIRLNRLDVVLYERDETVEFRPTEKTVKLQNILSLVLLRIIAQVSSDLNQH